MLDCMWQGDLTMARNTYIHGWGCRGKQDDLLICEKAHLVKVLLLDTFNLNYSDLIRGSCWRSLCSGVFPTLTCPVLSYLECLCIMCVYVCVFPNPSKLKCNLMQTLQTPVLDNTIFSNSQHHCFSLSDFLYLPSLLSGSREISYLSHLHVKIIVIWCRLIPTARCWEVGHF